MFTLKTSLVFRSVTTNLNFSRCRELRKLVKSFETFPEANTPTHPAESNLFRTQRFKVPLGDSSQQQALGANPFHEQGQRDLSVPTRDSNPEPNVFRLQELDPLPSPLAAVDPSDPPDLVPNFLPTFNFAAYVNKSESLQQLIKLGVDLSLIERRKGLPEFVLKLDFEKDVKPHLLFLSDLGLPANYLGEFITKNPLIFKEDLADLQVRINYLESKKFHSEQIIRIVTKDPFWLMFETKRIDRRLGHFQKTFKLSGDDIRFLATKQPRLITYNMDHIRKSTFCIREEMGFDEDETKCLLLSKPRLWMANQDDLIERFDFVHRTMNLSHDQIIQFPEILTSRLYRISQRHGFLKYLGKAQYDPSRELYVSLKQLVEGTDKDFVIHVAKSTINDYDTYLRSL